MKYRVGIDIGGTSIKIGIIDENCVIVKKSSVRTPDTFEESMKACADLINEVAAEMGLTMNDFPCVGIGTPGSIVAETGNLCFSNNTNWKDVPMKKELEKYITIPVYLGNDANCAIVGENIAGAAKGKKNVIMLTLGTGVGGGIIINGKLFAGGDGVGAELGHSVLVHDGYPCTCGINGCLEAYASATALIRQTSEAIKAHPESSMKKWAEDYGKVSGRTAFECARAGDEYALEVVNNYCSYIANGIGGIVNVFRPEIVLIGGGISNEGQYLLDKIHEFMPRYTFAFDVIGYPEIKRATLGNDAGIIGAAYLDQM